MASTSSKIEIFNMALGFIGTRTIASEYERTPEAIQCNLYWDNARRTALRDYPYHFAVRRVALAEKPLPEEYSHEWGHAYAPPDKCLKVLQIRRHGMTGKEPRRIPFRMGADVSGDIILCNVAQALADYTVDVADVGRWDDLFVVAMARKLACLIAIPLLGNNSQKVGEVENLYQMAIPAAEGQDASEEVPHRTYDTWLAARRL